MLLVDFGQSMYVVTGYPENGDEIGFDVYQRYLSNWDQYFHDEYGTLENFIQYVWQNTQKVKVVTKVVDYKYIGKLLGLSWNTEHLLSSNGIGDVDLLRISNQWKPIQAYYSIYSGLEAMIYVLDNKMQGHTKCLRKASELLASNKFYRQAFKPWSFAYKGYRGGGSRKISGTIQPINFPSASRTVHPLTNYASPAESILTCLHAEHIKRIEDYSPSKSDRKAGRFQYLHDPGYTTFFHFLYRLRIKANYENVETFLVDAPPDKIKVFSTSLSNMVNFTQVVIEMVIIRAIGLEKFLEIAASFLTKNPKAPIADRVVQYKLLSIV